MTFPNLLTFWCLCCSSTRGGFSVCLWCLCRWDCILCARWSKTHRGRSQHLETDRTSSLRSWWTGWWVIVWGTHTDRRHIGNILWFLRHHQLILNFISFVPATRCTAHHLNCPRQRHSFQQREAALHQLSASQSIEPRIHKLEAQCHDDNVHEKIQYQSTVTAKQNHYHWYHRADGANLFEDGQFRAQHNEAIVVCGFLMELVNTVIPNASRVSCRERQIYKNIEMIEPLMFIGIVGKT